MFFQFIRNWIEMIDFERLRVIIISSIERNVSTSFCLNNPFYPPSCHNPKFSFLSNISVHLIPSCVVPPSVVNGRTWIWERRNGEGFSKKEMKHDKGCSSKMSERSIFYVKVHLIYFLFHHWVHLDHHVDRWSFHLLNQQTNNSNTSF